MGDTTVTSSVSTHTPPSESPTPASTAAERPAVDTSTVANDNPLRDALRVGSPELHRGAAARRVQYDKSPHFLFLTDPPADVSDQSALDATLRQAFGGSVTIRGVADGDRAAEYHVKEALRQLAVQVPPDALRGQERDTLVQGEGDTKPLRLQIRVDDAGAVTATLFEDRGRPSVRRAFANPGEATAALRREFGITVVDSDGAEWKTAELEEVHHALSLLSGPEKARLQGLQFRREKEAKSTETGTHLHGQWRPPQFSPSGEVTTETVVLYDLAFSRSGEGFVGSNRVAHPQSVMATLHEVGHAIHSARFVAALKQRRGGLEAFALAAADYAGSAPSLSPAAVAAANKFSSNVDMVNDAVRELNTAKTPDAIEAARWSLRTAQSLRNSALEALKGQDDALVESAQALAVAQDQIIAATHRIADLTAAYVAAVERSPGAGASRPVVASKVVADFTKMRNRAGERPVTAYGENGAAEAFAEAFMLFVADPTFLRNERPETFEWFADGRHLK